MNTAHLPIHMQREMDALKQKIIRLSALVETDYQKAIQSLQERNFELAQQVIEGDQEIDQMEINVEEECLKIVALQQPVAGDLRLLASFLKTNNDLERIGDLAADIAKFVRHLIKTADVFPPFNMQILIDHVTFMVKNSLDAMIHLDKKLAYTVCATDDEVDKLRDQALEMITLQISKEPEKFLSYYYTMEIVNHLEYIADHAKKICEDVIYTATGKIVRHKKTWNQE